MNARLTVHGKECIAHVVDTARTADLRYIDYRFAAGAVVSVDRDTNAAHLFGAGDVIALDKFELI